MSKTKDYSMTLDEIIEAGEELVASYKKTASTAEIILNAVKELKALFSENSVATTEKPEAKPLPDKAPDKKEAPKYTNVFCHVMLCNYITRSYRKGVLRTGRGWRLRKIGRAHV